MIIQALCFDADGVIVYPQMQFSKRLAEEYGITPTMTRSFFDGEFNDCLVGKTALKDVLPKYLIAWGWQRSVEDFIQTWLRYDHVVDNRLVRKIQEFRQSGLVCCLTTNQEYNRAGYMKTSMGFQSIFDYLFFSCEIGWQKPQPVYFRAVQDTLDLEKEKVLFWDDSQGNVEAARQFGWQAELYSTFERFELTIQKYQLIGRKNG